MVTMTTRLDRATFLMARMQMTAARASRPEVGSLRGGQARRGGRQVETSRSAGGVAQSAAGRGGGSKWQVVGGRGSPAHCQ